jgi:ech hydrogenase subunit C
MANYLDRFDEFINNKDAKGASDLMYSIIEEEYRAKNSGKYDAERFGIMNTGDPMQADIFLITGGINEQNKDVVKQIYDQMPRPKVVVAVGVCACTGGVFKDCYNILGGADTVIPVDIYVPGCAARPQAIIDGIIKGVEIYNERAAKLESKGGNQ